MIDEAGSRMRIRTMSAPPRYRELEEEIEKVRKDNFVFQAKDGIRDRDVTGVQTCALPISAKRAGSTVTRASVGPACLDRAAGHVRPRSEERRVGRGCISRWSPYH